MKTSFAVSQLYNPLSLCLASSIVRILWETGPLEPLASNVCETLFLDVARIILTPAGVLNSHVTFAGGLTVTLHLRVRVSSSLGVLLIS